ncbi:MAG: hypothetical protein NQU46_05285 [Methanolinea sp.]|nr:hypothetical protein [Methanolinea sp.]
MGQWVRDMVGLGVFLWLLGYIASILLFFSPYAPIMGWVITPAFIPVTIAITWWWFRRRRLPLSYYIRVGLVWTVIAVVFDYLFIVVLFHATYYAIDVFLYYGLTFLIPVGVGLFIDQSEGKKDTEG